VIASVLRRDLHPRDQDVDQAFRALLPARDGADSGDPGEGAEQVERFDVEADGTGGVPTVNEQTD